MNNKNSASLLLLSSSRVGNTEYLEHALDMIDEHIELGGEQKEVLFIPYAGVTMSYDKYTEKVQSALSQKNIVVKGIHTFDDPISAINSASAIAIGGGNTFHLLSELYKHKLIDVIQERVGQGMKYIGWSAGSNVAGLSIRTTNDMPIIEPPSFNALGLINAQLNPHYTDFNPPGHNGETREERLQEFMAINPSTPIIGIVEGTALKVTNSTIKLIGEEDGFVFKAGAKAKVACNTVINDNL